MSADAAAHVHVLQLLPVYGAAAATPHLSADAATHCYTCACAVVVSFTAHVICNTCCFAAVLWYACAAEAYKAIEDPLDICWSWTAPLVVFPRILGLFLVCSWSSVRVPGLLPGLCWSFDAGAISMITTFILGSHLFPSLTACLAAPCLHCCVH